MRPTLAIATAICACVFSSTNAGEGETAADSLESQILEIKLKIALQKYEKVLTACSETELAIELAEIQIKTRPDELTQKRVDGGGRSSTELTELLNTKELNEHVQSLQRRLTLLRRLLDDVTNDARTIDAERGVHRAALRGASVDSKTSDGGIEPPPPEPSSTEKDPKSDQSLQEEQAQAFLNIAEAIVIRLLGGLR